MVLLSRLTPSSVHIENHNTSIMFRDGSRIKLIEHLLSAIYSLGISDIQISVDTDEIPLFDGSSLSYLILLKELTLVKKNGFKYAVLKKKIKVTDGDFYVELSPSNKLIYDFSIDFNNSLFGKEDFVFEFSPKKFEEEISFARTFGFIDNLVEAQSFFKGANINNTVIISNNKLLSTLRIDNELVKHKILDALGDMRCFPYFMLFKYKSFGGSHKLNNDVLKKVISENAFEVISVEEDISYSFEKAFAYV